MAEVTGLERTNLDTRIVDAALQHNHPLVRLAVEVAVGRAVSPDETAEHEALVAHSGMLAKTMTYVRPAQVVGEEETDDGN